jgi:two-component system phosphate regulon response regulator PhoB
MNVKKRVLIVDNSENIRKLVRVIMDKIGDYEYLEAADGREALAKAIEAKPDLIVQELILKGLDGLELCRKVRGRESTPVIILTSETTYNAVEQAKDAGADIFIGKPFDPEDLRTSVKELIG